ncbi:MAG: SDR family NAD(P)-dependent oxidoreductase [Pseudomonadota bacterium]
MQSAAGTRHVLIFGATSAVAAEVAVLYAERGDRLHLVGRNPEKLADVARRCARTRVTTQTADFAELEQNEACVETAVRTLGRVDCVLIAHGDIGDQLASEQNFADAEKILRVNFSSVVSLLIPLANHLERAKAGTIGVITSVAGERGRPRNYTYGAAKGALNTYLQGLCTRLYASGVSVTTIKLGPVDTPMTRDHKKHPLFGRVKPVARSILHALDTGAPEAYVPSFWRAAMPIIKNTPEWLFQRVPFLSGR